MASSPPLRVGYLLSSSLLEASDLLPSNLGRSTAIHSLAYHLDLLDLQRLDSDSDSDGSDDDGHSVSSAFDATDDGAARNEYARLLRHLGTDRESDRAARHAGQGRNRARVYPPKRAGREELMMYHSQRFVEALKREGKRGEAGEEEEEENVSQDEDSKDEDEAQPLASSRLRGIKRKRSAARKQKDQFGLLDDCPPFAGLGDHVELVAGASIRAAELLAIDEVDVAIVWDGGRHHAKKQTASGFCYVNDAVLAILALRKPRKRRIEVPVVVVPEAPGGSEAASGRQEQQRHDGTAQQAGSVAGTVEQEVCGTRESQEVQGERGDGSQNPSGDPASLLPPQQPAPSSPPPKRYKTVTMRMDRILYLDLDLHWGDGVEEAFYTSPSVLTLSVHHFAPGFFPCYQTATNTTAAGGGGGGGDGEAYGPPGSLTCQGGPLNTAAASKALSIPLGAGASRLSLERVMHQYVARIVEGFNPECLVVQLGLDGLAGDPMGVWNLDALSILEAVASLVAWLRDSGAEGSEGGGGGGGGCGCGGRKMLLLGGGGYDTPNAARCWSLVTALLLDRCDLAPDGAEEREKGDVERNTQVPVTCPTWPLFQPQATLDVASGEMADTNDPNYWETVDRVVRKHLDALAFLP
ncbi:hypothetical protein ACQY0O_005771 [Thecaphora frezii]